MSQFINQLLAQAPDMGLGTVLLIAGAIFGLGCGFLGFMLGTTVETAPLEEANRELERENLDLRDRVEHLEDTLSTMRAMEISAASQSIAARHQYEADMAELGRVIARMSQELAMYKELYEQGALSHVQVMNTYGSSLFTLGNRLVSEALTADADRRSLQLIIANLSEQLAQARRLNIGADADRQVMAAVMVMMSEELAHAKAEIASLRSHRHFDYLTTVVVRRGGQEFMAHVPSFYSRHALDSASHVLMRVCRIFGLPNHRIAISRMIKKITINGDNVTYGPCLAHIEPGDLVVVEFND